MSIGFTGGIAAKFQNLEITPLISIFGILLGAMALIFTPKEEDPQIDVTFANVFVPFPGATAKEVEQLVTIPAEQEFSKVQGVKHVYSMSRPGMSILTIEFKVGVARDPAVGRLYNAVFSTEDWFPQNLGVGRPLVKPKGIDDVPILTFTLWTDNAEKGAYELSQVANSLEAELKSIDGTRNVYTIGNPERVVRVTLDPEKMSAFKVSLSDMPNSFDIPAIFQASNYSRELGNIVTDNAVTPLQGGTFFNSVDEVKELVIGLRDGNPIYIRDVANVELGPATPEQYVWYGTGPAATEAEGKGNGIHPAVTIAVAKKSGENAVAVSNRVIERFEGLQGFLIPEDVKVTITRNYGETAREKSNRLIAELFSATFFVVLLVFLTMGWREGIIVGTAVIVTLAFTMFGNIAWGFTLNRVSLFALIFSIGILVDDAIVVVENVHRHMHIYPDRSLLEVIPGAVAEIGNPTIIATFAIVAAIMPMAFITGLMGPYMRPIPINASTGMLISLAIAFTITPWLCNKFLKSNNHKADSTDNSRENQPVEKESLVSETAVEEVQSSALENAENMDADSSSQNFVENQIDSTGETEKTLTAISEENQQVDSESEKRALENQIEAYEENAAEKPQESQEKPADHSADNASDGMIKLFRILYAPFLSDKWGRFNRIVKLLIILVLIAASLQLVNMRLVVLKMLPFDNKSEFQIVVDMPEGTPLEQTSLVMNELANYLTQVPEISNFTGYVGTHSPVNFNGLARQYYLRSGHNMGDIQVNLIGKDHRERLSHDIALAVREGIQDIGKKYNANLKVVEVPPGPPVQSSLVAEIYGPDYDTQVQIANQVYDVFNAVPDVIDTDTGIESPNNKLVLHIDRERAFKMGTAQMAIVDLLNTAVEGKDVSYLHVDHAKYPIPIRLELEQGYKADLDKLLTLELRSLGGSMISLSDFVSVKEEPVETSIYHKDLNRYVYVVGDSAGELDSPLYGMWDISQKLKETTFENGQKIQESWISLPNDPFSFSLKWDGEWQITYETFRDMAIAYTVGLILIYLLVVGYFRSYLVPLVIMAPIPLTIIGVMPGHALLNAQFTATSMIGMIALAGIIVRNSILLVDFINQSVDDGMPLKEAIIMAGAVRSKPIFLTAISAMLGAFFILADPIFNGLAISLIFGLFLSTLLTLIVIPIMYYAFSYKKFQKA